MKLFKTSILKIIMQWKAIQKTMSYIYTGGQTESVDAVLLHDSVPTYAMC
jgi:hypothetical protein